jgi:hypothetical protein
VTFVAVTKIEETELSHLTDLLAQHFVSVYGAPVLDAARPVALEELRQMQEICAEHTPNTLLTVARDLSDAGVRESYRSIEAQSAGLEQFALHVTPED